MNFGSLSPDPYIEDEAFEITEKTMDRVWGSSAILFVAGVSCEAKSMSRSLSIAKDALSVYWKKSGKVDSVDRFKEIIEYGQGLFERSQKALHSLSKDFFRGDMFACLCGGFAPRLEKFLKAMLPELQQHTIAILNGMVDELEFSDFCCDGDDGDMREFCELIHVVTELLEEVKTGKHPQEDLSSSPSTSPLDMETSFDESSDSPYISDDQEDEVKENSKNEVKPEQNGLVVDGYYQIDEDMHDNSAVKRHSDDIEEGRVKDDLFGVVKKKRRINDVNATSYGRDNHTERESYENFHCVTK